MAWTNLFASGTASRASNEHVAAVVAALMAVSRVMAVPDRRNSIRQQPTASKEPQL